jgi:hypothetical protein
VVLVTDRDARVESGSAAGGIRTEEDADGHADAEGERQAVGGDERGHPGELVDQGLDP